MNILLVNDDGIYSQGILTLAKKLLVNHSVILVAPQGQMSGMGHSITYYGHVNYTELKVLDGARCFAVNGTPADCVKVALHLIMDRKPDLIISGINKGFNLGSDVFYSGTVNAALEGCMQGVKSLAVSQEYEIVGFEYTSNFIAKNLQKFNDLLPNDAQTVFNINVPCGNEKDIKGVRFTKIGVKKYDESYSFENNLGYKLRGLGEASPNSTEDDDVYLYEKSYITVSAVKNDWNDYATYENLKREEFKL
ncbi:MAG: 5'/3'-nucleotidase SurE [Clostridia bacterium]|nr:5'/3'-nucleotidase SurE [Clostridia bacterium]MDE7328732.1 5'/3'-nucleotidase SurE [Clostridia bacterium]